MAIEKIGVLGCGLMGSGIVEVAAKAGYPVVVREVNQELLDKGMGRIRKSLDKAVDKGKLEASARDQILGRIQATTGLGDLGQCDLIVEAIIENVEEKSKVYRALGEATRDDVVLASNTSSLTITQLAMAAPVA